MYYIAIIIAMFFMCLPFYVKYSIINIEKHCFTPFFSYNAINKKIIILGGTGMYISEFTKDWDKTHGFTKQEALEKKAKVNEAHGVGSPNSKWNPAEIVPDANKQDGFKVVIQAKV